MLSAPLNANIFIAIAQLHRRVKFLILIELCLSQVREVTGDDVNLLSFIRMKVAYRELFVIAHSALQKIHNTC